MRKCMRILLVLLSVSCWLSYSLGAEQEFQSQFACQEEMASIPELTSVSIAGAYTLYERKSDYASFGPLESNLVTYVAWRNTYYGTIIPICGEDVFHAVMRSFENSALYGQPISNNKTRTIVWLSDPFVFRLTRFSYHLGQLEVLCRERFFEIEFQDEVSK